jgi:hypothetical protein
MAVFVGTVEEFKKYIGPRVRNLTNAVARDYRRDIGKCEHCSAPTTWSLRTPVGEKGLSSSKRFSRIILAITRSIINLEQFEIELKEKHGPIILPT